MVVQFSTRRIVTPMTNNDLSSVDDFGRTTRWRSRKGAFNNFIIHRPNDEEDCNDKDKFEELRETVTTNLKFWCYLITRSVSLRCFRAARGSRSMCLCLLIRASRSLLILSYECKSRHKTYADWKIHEWLVRAFLVSFGKWLTSVAIRFPY